MAKIISGRRLVWEICSYLCDIHQKKTDRREFKIDPLDENLHLGFDRWFYADLVPNLGQDDRYIDISPPNIITGFNQGFKSGLSELTDGFLSLRPSGGILYKIDVPHMEEAERVVKSLTVELTSKLYDQISSRFLDFTW